MSDSTEPIRTILNTPSLSGLPVGSAIELVGTFVDAAFDARRADVLRHVAALPATIDLSAALPAERTSLDYYLGNLWNGIKAIESPHPTGGWEWERPEVENEITCLRRAVQSGGFASCVELRRCQILTNLGNAYSTTGRFIEAVEAWNEALAIEPRFGMARANRGVGRWSYAHALYDNGHAMLFAHHAWRDLDPDALRGIERGARPHFATVRAEIAMAVRDEFLRAAVDLENWPLGDSDEEVSYRWWSLRQRLFLNPLNDLGAIPIAARDVLTAPSIVAPIGQGPRYHGFFNQIKQEYCAARWLAYESITRSGPHFADRGVLLYNTLDYPSYSIATEKLKLSFRACYSIFDKIAYLLNAYLALGIPERSASFRGIWYIGQQRNRGIRPEFDRRENWPLRGLYWLAKDLFEDKDEFRSAIEPAAQQLNEIRNHVEHKYLKLHLPMWVGPRAADLATHLIDDLAKSVRLEEFEATTIKLMQLCRAAIIYLSLGVHREEQLREAQRPRGSITPPMFLDTLEDDWK
jgi:hypothetical protein